MEDRDRAPEAAPATRDAGALASTTGPRRRAPLQALLSGLIVPAVVSLAMVLVLGPSLLTQPTTPTGFDLGGHVYPLSRALELVPVAGLPGWDDGWFGGFPLYYFYFPLPAALVWLAGLLVPFQVAVKLVSVSGLLALPFATYVLARGVGFGRPVSVACVLGAGMFAFMQSYFFLGANLSSTLAGEFSYGIAFSLSLVYLGMVARTARGGPQLGVLAALVLALTALSHLLPTAVVVAASLPLLTIRRSRRPVLVSWIVGFLLSGLWSVPFLARYGLSPEIPWEHVPVLSDVLPREVWLLVPLALGGAVLTFGKRWAAVPLLLPPLAGLAFYLVAPPAVHPGRLLPYWFFALHLLAAVLTGGALLRFTRDRWLPALAGGLVGIAAFVLISAARDLDRVRTWAAWNYSGYETKPGWPTYATLIETLQQLPPGRVHAEDAEIVASFGTPNALTLLPYWSPDHPFTGGLWIESSLSAPAWLLARRETSAEEVSRSDPRIGEEAGLDLERGIHHMRLLGARYYVAFSQAAVQAALSRPELRRVAEAEPFSIFELDAALVEVALATPSVLDDPRSFADAAAEWTRDPAGFARWLVADGPPAWPRTGTGADEVAETLRDRVAPGVTGDPSDVTDVAVGRSEISFHTTAVGVPHLIKVSWFPNWRAEGAIGPYRAAPAYMVVVPNRETVRLRFRRTWAEWLGLIASIAGGFLFVSGMLHVGVTWAFLSRTGEDGDPDDADTRAPGACDTPRDNRYSTSNNGRAAAGEPMRSRSIPGGDPAMSDGTILISGATGQQGGAVARELLAAGRRVRAMTRRPDSQGARALADLGAEIVQADLDDEASLRAALDGAWGALAVQNTWEAGVEGEEAQGKRFARVAREAGVQHYVYQSVGSAHQDTGIPHFDNKYRVEQTILGLGFPSHVIIRPVFFMENLLSPWFKPYIDQGNLAFGMEPDTALQMIAVADIGKYGALAFLEAERMNGKAIDIAGDELTGPEAARILSDVTGRDIQFYRVPIEQVREGSEEFAIMLEWFDAVGYSADIAGNERTYGIAPTSFRDWAGQQDWTPSAG